MWELTTRGNTGARFYAWACERLYAELATVYDPVSWAVSLGGWDAWRCAALAHVRGDIVLELGFGTGRLLPQLAQRAKQVVGVEKSAAMICQAQRMMRKAQEPRGDTSVQRVQLVEGEAQSLPLPDQSVDTVVATFPAPYIFAADTLAEILRVLRSRAGEASFPDTKRRGPRLVVAGLWVEPQGRSTRARLMGLVPFFYGRPGADRLWATLDGVAAAGFSVHTHEAHAGGAKVGIMVAQPDPTRTSSLIGADTHRDADTRSG